MIMQNNIFVFFLWLFYPCESAVELNLCDLNFAGLTCILTCSVPDFEKDITFNHLPPRSVGTCLKGSPTCKSRYNYTIQRDAKANEAYLEIKKLDNRAHTGNWSCSYGLEESKPKDLHVYQPQSATKPTLYVSTTENSNLILLCDIDAKKQSHRVDWYFNGTKIYKFNRHIFNSFFPASLTINPVIFSDGGLYRCSVAVPNGSTNIMYGQFISVTVSKNAQKDVDVTIVTVLLSLVVVFVVIAAVILSYHIYRLCLRNGKDKENKTVPQTQTEEIILETRSRLLEDEPVIDNKTERFGINPSSAGAETTRDDIKTRPQTAVSGYIGSTDYSGYRNASRHHTNRQSVPCTYYTGQYSRSSNFN